MPLARPTCFYQNADLTSNLLAMPHFYPVPDAEGSVQRAVLPGKAGPQTALTAQALQKLAAFMLGILLNRRFGGP